MRNSARRGGDAHHVGVDEGHTGLSLHPPHRWLIIRPVLIPFLPPAGLRLDVGLLRIRDLLESAEREELGAELASNVEEVVAPEELKFDLFSRVRRSVCNLEARAAATYPVGVL